MLSRYGGGLSTARVRELLQMPLCMMIRLMGAARVASGGKRALGSCPAGDEAAIAEMLDERVKRMLEKDKKAAE